MKRTRSMQIYSTAHFVLPLPPGDRFPMQKYALLRERIAHVAADLLQTPEPATPAQLALVHERSYVDAMIAGRVGEAALRRIGFPWSEAMVERSLRSVGATLAACLAALAEGCGVNLAGGTHHAHRDFGAGFCVFNDAAVAARAMQAEGLAARILIVDLDVHQGDGTAAIFAGDASVYTFSMHGKDNFPFRKHASHLDVELADGTGDDAYLAALSAALPRVIAAASPDLAIYLAGADPYAGDRLGRLALTKAGLATRDTLVLDALRRDGIPVAIAMAGGYAPSIDDIVDIHYATVALALERYRHDRVLDFCGKPRIRARTRGPLSDRSPQGITASP